MRSCGLLLAAFTLGGAVDALHAQTTFPTGVQTTDAPAASAAAGSGIWWGVGLGAGAMRLTCDICAADRERGPAVNIMLGATATSSVRVAAEAGGWTYDDDGVRETLFRAGVTGYVYPLPNRGLHLLGGVNWVGYRADQLRYDSGALSVGVGWDVAIIGGWTVGNALRLEAASFGSLRNEDATVARNVGLRLMRVEVSVKRF